MDISPDEIEKIINDDWLLMDECEGFKNCDAVKAIARLALLHLKNNKTRVLRLPRPGFMTTGNHGFAKNDVLAACKEAGINLETGGE
ncbi:hypothetical protein [Cronobacter malonaticus]|uniref:hypothetical protein n=1 Tax=Cronobacter malonaticus TaxID=413503 RepID=UPI000CFD18C5|nr:hypothetical protein [Cronobacter malonaticus]MDT3595649.1 hypothetical protein [Cronobacter malonaticus]